MVGTKHYCWGECKTDSRHADKWPKSLKELEESGRKYSFLSQNLRETWQSASVG